MSEALKSVGEKFRLRRQEINLTLKEVENMTSIRMNYLKAIEDGQVQLLISPVYAQGFVKQYASFLGIDGDRIIQENPLMFGKGKKQEFAYGIGTLEIRATSNSGIKWIPNALWLFLSVGVVFLAWLFAKYLNIL